MINKFLSVLPNQKALKNIVQQYKELVKYAQHWVVPQATPKTEPNKAEKKAVGTLMKYVNEGLSGLGKRRESGEIKSHDVLGFPVEHEGQRLGLSLPEWQDILYRAMAVTKDELEKIIADSEYLDVLGKAYQGRTLRVVRKGNYPIDLVMKITGRPVIKDIGSVGENSIYGKHFSRITNTPSGEEYMSPLEDTVNGEFYSKIPLVTEKGTIEGIHLVFCDGRVVEAEATRGLDALEHYVGLAEPKTEVEKKVYAIQNTAAELGIGINPVLNFEGTTGNPLIDEKNEGAHFAVGGNNFYGGKNPNSIGNMYVEHTDIILGKIDKMYVI